MKPTRERAIAALNAMIEATREHRERAPRPNDPGCVCLGCLGYRAAMAELEKP